MTLSLHRASGQLCFKPSDIVRMVLEEWYPLWSEWKLQPSLRVASRGLAIKEGGACTQGKKEGCFTTHQAQRSKQQW